MKFSVVAIVASVAAVASAIEYPFAPTGQCMAACNMDIGKKIFADYTMDPNNPNFLKSQELELVKGTPSYTRFMTEGGMCWSKCPTEETQAYMKDFPERRIWYQKQTGTFTGTPSGAPQATYVPPNTKPTPTAGASALTVSGLAAVAAGAVAFALF
ncbi:hypothetical protein BGZ73_001061 [Actinomortierella ambigua]|nr:hypothetical protein BGZ73_001061 [Actinomortierella ambigua]